MDIKLNFDTAYRFNLQHSAMVAASTTAATGQMSVEYAIRANDDSSLQRRGRRGEQK